jgi:hypothetical protein
MTNEILTSENLIEIHENLNDFAKHHQNLGGQKAYKLIKVMWDESKPEERVGGDDQEGFWIDQGFNRAFRMIFKELRREFLL